MERKKHGTNLIEGSRKRPKTPWDEWKVNLQEYHKDKKPQGDKGNLYQEKNSKPVDQQTRIESKACKIAVADERVC